MFLSKNRQFRQFERLISGSDMSRQYAKQDLPWILEQSTFRDAENDTWAFQSALIRFGGVDRIKSFKTEIQLQAVLNLDKKSLNNLGFDGQRILDILGIKTFDISEIKTFQVSCELSKLEDSCHELREAFLDKIQKLVPKFKKQQMVVEKMADARIGGFGSYLSSAKTLRTDN
jgi:hypothetical protein